MKDEIFDKRIKELADSFLESPGDDVWAGIESHLNASRRKRSLRQIINYAAAAAVAVGVMATVLTYSPGKSEHLAVKTTPDNALSGGTSVNSSTGNNGSMAGTGAHGSRQSIDILPNSNQPQAVTLAAEETEDNQSLTLTDEISAAVVSSSAVNRQTQENQPASRQPQEDSQVIESVTTSENSLFYSYVMPEKAVVKKSRQSHKTNNKSRFSLAASGHVASTDTRDNVAITTPSYVYTTYSAGNSTSSSDAKRRVHHNLPVTLGIEAKYSFLKDRLSLGLGLNYTHLTSRFAAQSGSDQQYFGAVNQSLHYVGIPLSLYVNLLSSERLQVYASAGCQLEKAVKASYEVTESDGSRRKEDIDVKGLQWSANMGIGLEYKFLNRWGLYLDPQLTYFFDCAQPYSVRIDQPLQFNLELGLRFHIGA